MKNLMNGPNHQEQYDAIQLAQLSEGLSVEDIGTLPSSSGSHAAPCPSIDALEVISGHIYQQSGSSPKSTQPSGEQSLSGSPPDSGETNREPETFSGIMKLFERIVDGEGMMLTQESEQASNQDDQIWNKIRGRLIYCRGHGSLSLEGINTMISVLEKKMSRLSQISLPLHTAKLLISLMNRLRQLKGYLLTQSHRPTNCDLHYLICSLFGLDLDLNPLDLSGVTR